MRALLNSRNFFLFIVVGLISLAWWLLWAWGESPYGRFLSHSNLGQLPFSDLLVVLVFVAGWVLMTIAMMLPTSLPLLNMFYTLVRRKPDRAILLYLLIAGYLCIWTLFGTAAHLADWVLHRLVNQNLWLQAHPWLIGAALLGLAGAYQFTPLKYYCLEKCRSPLTFITQHWQGKNQRLQSLQLGFRHGLFCLGCCWSLMLLMFVMGTGNLGWMMVLGLIMAVEKNSGWGKKLSLPLGVILLGAAVMVVLTSRMLF